MRRALMMMREAVGSHRPSSIERLLMIVPRRSVFDRGQRRSHGVRCGERSRRVRRRPGKQQAPRIGERRRSLVPPSQPGKRDIEKHHEASPITNPGAARLANRAGAARNISVTEAPVCSQGPSSLGAHPILSGPTAS